MEEKEKRAKHLFFKWQAIVPGTHWCVVVLIYTIISAIASLGGKIEETVKSPFQKLAGNMKGALDITCDNPKHLLSMTLVIDSMWFNFTSHI